MWEHGKCTREYQSADLPMTGDGILARGCFCHATEGADRIRFSIEPLHRGDAAETKTPQVGNGKRDPPRDVAEGIAADVAVIAGVGQLATPHAVEHNEDDAVWYGRLAQSGFVRRVVVAHRPG